MVDNNEAKIGFSGALTDKEQRLSESLLCIFDMNTKMDLEKVFKEVEMKGLKPHYFISPIEVYGSPRSITKDLLDPVLLDPKKKLLEAYTYNYVILDSLLIVFAGGYPHTQLLDVTHGRTSLKSLGQLVLQREVTGTKLSEEVDSYGRQIYSPTSYGAQSAVFCGYVHEIHRERGGVKAENLYRKYLAKEVCGWGEVIPIPTSRN